MWVQMGLLASLVLARDAAPTPRMNVVVPRPADLPYLTNLIVKPVTDEIVIEPPRRFGEPPFIVRAVVEASDTGERSGLGDVLLFAGEHEERTVKVGGHQVLMRVSIDPSGRRVLVDVCPSDQEAMRRWRLGQRIAVWLPGSDADDSPPEPWPAQDGSRRGFEVVRLTSSDRYPRDTVEGPRPTMLEIQYHPADIASGPRYWFLRPAAVRRLGAAIVVLAVVPLAGIALAPRGISAIFLWGRIARLQDGIAAERQTLASSAAELAELGKRFDQARLLGERLELVFGGDAPGSYAGGTTAVLLDGDAAADPGVALLEARALALDSEVLLGRAERLAGLVADQRELAAVVPSTCPLTDGSFVLTSPYGSRISPFTGRPDFHSGIDLAARQGETVHAAGDGIVTFAGRFPLSRNPALWRLGNVVVVNHGDRYLTIYAHLKGITVRSGATVTRADPVGTVGNTGWSTSPHLHYEVRQLQPTTREQTPLDPRIFILDHDWSEQETWLVASRKAPPPVVDPLPVIAKGR